MSHGWPNFRIVTANIWNHLNSVQRRADVATVYDTFDQPDPIVCWQEIRDSNFKTDLIASVPAGTQIVHPCIPTPISVSSRYDISDEGFVPTKPETGPEQGGYDVGSAARWMGWVKLTDKVQTGLRSFYVINTHFTNGCEWDNPTPSAQALFLRPYWTAQWDALKAKVDEIKAADYTVFWAADFNRSSGIPEIGTAEKVLAGSGSIDKVYVIDRGVDTALDASGLISLNSDHNARWAKVHLTNRP